MFATRRSLSEATTKIAKELENVYSSISVIVSSLCHILLTLKFILYAYASWSIFNIHTVHVKLKLGIEIIRSLDFDWVFSCAFQSTKRHLSSKIDRVDTGLDEAAKLTDATRGEVGTIRGFLLSFVYMF